MGLRTSFCLSSPTPLRNTRGRHIKDSIEEAAFVCTHVVVLQGRARIELAEEPGHGEAGSDSCSMGRANKL